MYAAVGAAVTQAMSSKEGAVATLSALFKAGTQAVDVVDTILDYTTHNEERSSASLAFVVAPSFGSLTSEAVRLMDRELVTALDVTIKTLERKVAEMGAELKWNEVLSALNNNPAIVADGAPKAESDILKFESNDWFKFDGSPDPAKIQQIQSFLTNLLKDEDILISVGLKDAPGACEGDPHRKSKVSACERIKNIVAETGARVTDPLTLVHKKETYRETLLDIGILRYPCPTKPYINVYRVLLQAVGEHDRWLGYEENRCSLYCEYNSLVFRPNKSVLSRLDPKLIDQSVSEVAAMLAGSSRVAAVEQVLRGGAAVPSKPTVRAELCATYAIKSKSSGCYLDGRAMNDTKPLLTSRPPQNDAYLQWQFVPVAGAEDGRVAIQSCSSHGYLDGRCKGMADPCISYRKLEPQDLFLQWTLVPVDDPRAVAIQSCSSNGYLDGRGPGMPDPLITYRSPQADGYLHWELVRL
eukprot:m51a1_g12597 hypothetical protein (469) ;mRNA; f:1024-2495